VAARHHATARRQERTDCAILSLEARRGILTANATTPYYLGFADLSEGPLVMVIPQRGVQGGISDAWQRTIPGSETPGTYLVLAPGQKAPDNVDGYTVRQSLSFNIFLGARLTDADPEQAKEALSQLLMYPYAQHANPPKAEILDVGTKAWSGLPPRGMEYWQRLNDVIQREPIEPHDIFFNAMLRPLGLEKDKPFKPDPRQTKILTDAALVGKAGEGQLRGSPFRGREISVGRALGLCAATGRRRSRCILESAR
jgi:hypothetical protein